MIKVAFRVDASPTMGIGHISRCLALAHALARLGAKTVFVTRDLGIDSVALIEARGFDALRLPPPGSGYTSAAGPAHATWAGVPQDRDANETLAALGTFGADWIVVDHYAFDHRWHERVAAAPLRRICVIDDVADRPLRADLLVDHNPATDHRSKYATQAPDVPRLLGGTRYALLGPAYADAPRYAFRPEVRSIGIFMGGTDARQLSALALRACREVAWFEGRIEVVTTSANPQLDSLQRLCLTTPATELHIDLPDLSAFFARHDLQIGAGGGAAWERCCVGAPTLTLQWADNQAVVLEALAARGAVRTSADLSVETVGKAVAELLADPAGRHALSETSQGWVDGRGAERVALALHADAVSLRPATAEDAADAHRWRNDARTRQHFRNPAPVAWDDHLDWWSRSLHDERRRLLVACCGPQAVGSVRFDLADDAAEISLYVDPELTGLGLGRGLLEAAQRWIAAQASRVRRIVAEVLPANIASAHAFRAAGFAHTPPSHWSWEAPR